jgi:hypothetical protein
MPILKETYFLFGNNVLLVGWFGWFGWFGYYLLLFPLANPESFRENGN